MDGFNAHILSDEASAGSVVVGTGISAALLLFFQQSFERMLPYLVIAAVVILIDLVFGIRAGVKVDAAKVIEAVVEAKTGANIEGAITIKKAEESEKQRGGQGWQGRLTTS